MKRVALLTVAVALVLAAPAGACPVSPKGNGTGYAPPANARSLPPDGTGPEVLHSALPRSPQLRNARNWTAEPIMISGAQAYREGEFLYQDFLYDDRALSYPSEPERLARNAADIVEVRIEPLRRATAIRVTLNSMLDPQAAAVTIGLGDGPLTEMPHGAGARMPAKVFVTAHGCSGHVSGAKGKARVTTDLRRRQIDIRVPHRVFDPRGRKRVRVGAAAGLWDAAANAYLRPDPERPAFFNVAFRDYGPWRQNTWMDSSQNAALAAGDLSPLHALVNFRKLAAGRDDERAVPRTGPMNRILVSRFEAVQGRGNSDGGDIFGNFACDPPECTHQFSGRLQPYSVYVPAKRKPRAGFGLVVNLHGADSNHNHFEGGSTEPPLSVWQMLAEEGHPSVMAMPNARGMTYCYFGLAGADVFEMWADVAAHYDLDPRHALLSGSSMGGFGTYKLSSQFPDLFKAIFPNIAPELCDLTEAAGGLDVPGRTTIGPTLAGLRNVPVLAPAGLDDPLVNAALTTRTAARLDAFGYRYDLWQFEGLAAGGHAEYRQFVRDEYRALNATSNRVVRNPRRVTFVLDQNTSDPRYGTASDHAYYVSGLELADAGASPPRGTIDVIANAIPARTQQALPSERATGSSVNGSNAYIRTSRRWRAGADEPISNRFFLRATNLGAATLDLRRMRLSEGFEATIETDAELELTLRGPSGRSETVTVPPGTTALPRG